MRIRFKFAVFVSVFFYTLPLSLISVNAAELTGSATVESMLFTHSPQYKSQKHHSSSIAFTSECYNEFESGSSITIKPFVRLDNNDTERTHVDLREFNFLYLADKWQLKTGISKVFWGATEFVHLVDIINQTDLVEDINSENKLGQPMLHLSFFSNWGVIDGFILPFFRERTFPGIKGRLRAPIVIDTDKTTYESTDKENHIDFALRYSHTIGSCDLAISQFIGTSREPILLEKKDDIGESVLAPYYPQISQTGIDFQLVAGQWLWKGEAFYRSGQKSDFIATTFGFEYTIYGFCESDMDLGIIGEYVFDDRDESISNSYNNDAMFGLRLLLNDIDNTEILFGVIKDLEYSSTIFSIEASRRFGESFKIEVTGNFFENIGANDPISILRNDDYMKIQAIFYF